MNEQRNCFYRVLIKVAVAETRTGEIHVRENFEATDVFKKVQSGTREILE